jgi:lactoylglutathione lyase
MSASSRPFRVLGVQQIAVGAPDKKDLRRLWVDLLGLEVRGSFRSERENVDEDIATAGAGPFAVEVDLMQPIDPAGRPKVHEPALNHVGLWVDDLPAAVAWLTEQGVRFTPGGIRKGAAGFDVCFIHPKGSEPSPLGGEGVLIELVQAPPEVIEAHRRLSGPRAPEPGGANPVAKAARPSR